MKNLSIKLKISLILLFCKTIVATNKHEIEFNISMESTSKEFKKKYNNKTMIEELNFLKQLFTNNSPENIVLSKELKIPKTIHQIWVGPKPIPENCKLMQKTWKKYHPNWEYILWTDENVKNLKLHNQELYNKTKDMREKADILRYELLYQFGGLYVDSDYECIKNFDSLNYYDFYVGIAPNNVGEIINNAIIGCKKGHPILKNIIDNIKYEDIPDWRNRSGVFYFDKQIRKALKTSPGINIAFPKNYFYAIPFQFDKNNTLITNYIKPESMALHYWMNSSGTNWNWKPQKNEINNV